MLDNIYLLKIIVMLSLISNYHLVQYPLIILICLNFFTIIY